jgi:thiamine biosynthesis lipoprotein
MACDVSVIMDPGPTPQIEAASAALDEVHAIEDWLSLYRETSELSIVNRTAFESPVEVRPLLFALLELADELYRRTSGAFDMAAGALTQLWRQCRREFRIPEPAEIEAARERCGWEHVRLDAEARTVRFMQPGLVLDPGAIGKGFALDLAAGALRTASGAPQSWLFHGGHSSLIAQGPHNGHAGWPVGVGNPLFTEKRLGTLLLTNQAMATSGSNIQFFRHAGRRYGHILDPRTGCPVEGMLSVTVLADSAAVADALATAFFVMGVENARRCCENWPGVGAILLPFPEQSTRVQPIVSGIDSRQMFWDVNQVMFQASRAAEL